MPCSHRTLQNETHNHRKSQHLIAGNLLGWTEIQSGHAKIVACSHFSDPCGQKPFFWRKAVIERNSCRLSARCSTRGGAAYLWFPMRSDRQLHGATYFAPDGAKNELVGLILQSNGVQCAREKFGFLS